MPRPQIPRPSLAVQHRSDSDDTYVSSDPSANLLPNRTKSKEGQTSRRPTVTLLASRVLHPFLIAIYVALIGVYSRHYEHGVTMDINTFSDTWLPFILSTGSQIFGTGYTALLVFLTQRLALRRDIHSGQTLTALHDKSGAWMGLGAAFTSIRQQMSLRSDFAGVSRIAAYLVGIFVLHTTIPSVLDVVPYNATISTTQTTVLANSTFNLTTFYIYRQDFEILNFYNQIPTPGLLDNMVYDVVSPLPNAIGSATVNASVYEVECEMYHDAVRTGFDIGSDPGAQYGRYEFVDGLSRLNQLQIVNPGAAMVFMGSNVVHLNMSTLPCDDGWQCGGVPLVVGSTLPVVDSAGTAGFWTPLYPQYFQTSPHYALLTGVQIMLCNVRITDTRIQVSAQDGHPLSPAPVPSNILWKNWTLPEDLAASKDPRLIVARATPQNSGSNSQSSRAISGSFLAENVTAEIGPPLTHDTTAPLTPPLSDALSGPKIGTVQPLAPSVFDLFVMDDLNLTDVSNNTLRVADINRSIGKALAAVYWYGKLLAGPEVQLHGEAQVLTSVVRARLNLSLTPIIAGLSASLALLALSFILTRPTSRRTRFVGHSGTIDTTGILEVTWLLGRQPELASVGTPTTKALRAAGMFVVQPHMAEPHNDKLVAVHHPDDAVEATVPLAPVDSSFQKSV